MAFRMEPLQEVLEEDVSQLEVLEADSLTASAEMQSGEQTSNATCRQMEEELSLMNGLSEQEPQVQANVLACPVIIAVHDSKTTLTNSSQTKNVGVNVGTAGIQKSIEVSVGDSYQMHKYPMYAINGKFLPGNSIQLYNPNTNSSELQMWDYELYEPKHTVRHDRPIQTSKPKSYNKAVTAHRRVATKSEATTTTKERGTGMFMKIQATHCEEPKMSTNEKNLQPHVVLSRLSFFSKRLKTMGADLHELIADLKTTRSNTTIARSGTSSVSQRGGSNFWKPPFKGPTRSPLRNHLGGKFRKRAKSPMRSMAVMTTGQIGHSSRRASPPPPPPPPPPSHVPSPITYQTYTVPPTLVPPNLVAPTIIPPHIPPNMVPHNLM